MQPRLGFKNVCNFHSKDTICPDHNFLNFDDFITESTLKLQNIHDNLQQIIHIYQEGRGYLILEERLLYSHIFRGGGLLRGKGRQNDKNKVVPLSSLPE